QKWLTVGCREEGQKRQKQKRGTPQGAIISPLLANIVLNEAQACLRPRDRFWDIPVPKIDSAFDNLFVPQPSWSPSTTQQLRKLVAAPYLSPNDWTPRSEAYFVFPLAQGTPGKQCGLAATGVYQPSLRSPWLAAMDSYVRHWRKRHARGEVYIVRYADDAILSFEHKADADALRTALEEQLQRYGLELNEAKTHLRRFGRNSSRGGGRSETFDFLGLTHIAGKDRRGRYLVKRKTARKKMRRSLELMRLWCRKHRHEPLAWQWKELSAKLRGHYAYYGIRGNLRSLGEYRYQVWKYWRQCLLLLCHIPNCINGRARI
uniref:reverse transcriptase domain-containing protein n=3 Tax=Thiolapillus sp. TaxID=2017437 RepID=UPI003AF6E494